MPDMKSPSNLNASKRFFPQLVFFIGCPFGDTFKGKTIIRKCPELDIWKMHLFDDIFSPITLAGLFFNEPAATVQVVLDIWPQLSPMFVLLSEIVK